MLKGGELLTNITPIDIIEQEHTKQGIIVNPFSVIQTLKICYILEHK